MATVKENLITARDNFAANLASISASHKPTYSINGQSISWVDYMRFLQEQIALLDDAIARQDGGFEIETRFFS